MKKLQYHHRLRQYRQLQLETEHARLEQFVAKLHALDQLENALAPLEVSKSSGIPESRAYSYQMSMMLAERRAELKHQIAAQRRELMEARRRYELLSSVWSTHDKSTSRVASGRERDGLARLSLALG